MVALVSSSKIEKLGTTKQQDISSALQDSMQKQAPQNEQEFLVPDLSFRAFAGDKKWFGVEDVVRKIANDAFMPGLVGLPDYANFSPELFEEARQNWSSKIIIPDEVVKKATSTRTESDGGFDYEITTVDKETIAEYIVTIFDKDGDGHVTEAEYGANQYDIEKEIEEIAKEAKLVEAFFPLVKQRWEQLDIPDEIIAKAVRGGATNFDPGMGNWTYIEQLDAKDLAIYIVEALRN